VIPTTLQHGIRSTKAGGTGRRRARAVKCCVLCNFGVKPVWADTKFTQSGCAAVVDPLEKKLIADFGFFE
jgi:hypothetical protein